MAIHSLVQTSVAPTPAHTPNANRVARHIVAADVGQLRQLNGGARPFGEQIGDAEFGRHIDDGCHAVPGDEVN